MSARLSHRPGRHPVDVWRLVFAFLLAAAGGVAFTIGLALLWRVTL